MLNLQQKLSINGQADWIQEEKIQIKSATLILSSRADLALPELTDALRENKELLPIVLLGDVAGQREESSLLLLLKSSMNQRIPFVVIDEFC
jgi:hypothetical protein